MSLRRFLHKLRTRFRKPPERPRDLIRDYKKYLALQRETYLSHESDVRPWADGLKRFVEIAFAQVDRASRVLDCACGDGVALEVLRGLGFKAPVGVELSPQKAARARSLGFLVEERDMHDLSIFDDGSFDIVLSSHTLEHAYEPNRVLDEIRRVLAPNGVLFVVLPYPDPGTRNELAHPAKYQLGTHLEDGGATVTRYFAERGFEAFQRRFDSLREPEIWLFLRKVEVGSPLALA